MPATQEQTDAVNAASQALAQAIGAADQTEAAEKAAVQEAAAARDSNAPNADALSAMAADAERKAEDARAAVATTRQSLADVERVVSEASAAEEAASRVTAEPTDTETAVTTGEPGVVNAVPAPLLGEEGASDTPAPPETSLLAPTGMPAEIAEAVKAWVRREIHLFSQGHGETTRVEHNP